jgi:hypothetical protein
MEEDEVLRLCQITGLSGLFKDEDFSRSWDIKDSAPDDEVKTLDDVIDEEEKEKYGFRTINTDDENRIFHTFDKWECHKAGFYGSKKEGMTAEQCEQEYCNFLSNDERFKQALQGILNNWINSCEHYLTNKAMNRISWLGQAAVCFATGIPSKFCAGFNLLTSEQQERANEIALEYLNIWRVKYNLEPITMNEALSIGRQVNIY